MKRDESLIFALVPYFVNMEPKGTLWIINLKNGWRMRCDKNTMNDLRKHAEKR